MTDTWLWLKYFVLGIVQGVTEPIPVSSSGHLVVAQKLLDVEQNGLSLEVLLNTASLLAILVIYRSVIGKLIVNGAQFALTRKREYRSDFMFIVYVIIGTIPAGVIGVLFKDDIERIFTSVHTVAITLLITGCALWLIRNLRGKKRDGDLRTRDALLVGLAQAVALIPGISRSGATVIASVAVGMKQETALRFSFMLYIPVSLGGIVLGLSDITSDPEFSSLLLPYILAFAATLVTTYFSMKWLMNIMEKGNLGYFAYYCFIVGILLFIFM
ncbi:undecaprenyl-diphosphate phosphatase [Paenibacillus sp. HB172176]|uniref:undecaprenyl-diphosphate phosphatase n=1 Tax=Paenibacillus sp. HB172176 TaxID=2493690 RepID=UPI001438923E|nr:undecaprenyl-diphosphate phosphatase [Paenibacillus sp. HB172176]